MIIALAGSATNRLTKQDDRESLEPLVDQAEETLREELFTGLAAIALSPVAGEFARGDSRPLVESLTQLSEQLSLTSVGAFREAAIATNRLFPELVFDDSDGMVSVLHGLARDRMRADLVDSVGEFSRAINEVILNRGLRERAITRLVRDSMGLNGAGIRAVERFREQLIERSRDALRRKLGETLEDAVRRAIDDGTPLTITQVDEFATRYRRQLVSRRVGMISRLQAQQVVHEGSEEMLRQAFDRALIDPDDVEQEWNTSPPRVRDSHSAMRGDRQPVGQAFTSGDGNLLRFPGDPTAPLSDTANCKCFLTIVRS